MTKQLPHPTFNENTSKIDEAFDYLSSVAAPVVVVHVKDEYTITVYYAGQSVQKMNKSLGYALDLVFAKLKEIDESE